VYSGASRKLAKSFQFGAVLWPNLSIALTSCYGKDSRIAFFLQEKEPFCAHCYGNPEISKNHFVNKDQLSFIIAAKKIIRWFLNPKDYRESKTSMQKIRLSISQNCNFSAKRIIQKVKTLQYVQYIGRRIFLRL
jgi:hypothetical protein